MGPFHVGVQQCPICPWEGKNRYYHMRQKHHLTMSDWEGYTDAQKEQLRNGITTVETRFGDGGEHIPYQTFQ